MILLLPTINLVLPSVLEVETCPYFADFHADFHLALSKILNCWSSSGNETDHLWAAEHIIKMAAKLRT